MPANPLNALTLPTRHLPLLQLRRAALSLSVIVGLSLTAVSATTAHAKAVTAESAGQPTFPAGQILCQAAEYSEENAKAILASATVTATACSEAAFNEARPEAFAAGAETPDDFADLASKLQLQFERVEKTVAPSVVAISVAITARGDDDTVRSDDMTGRKLTGLLERTTRTVGTGAILSADGLILTNEHVICEAQQIWVTTDGGKVYPAYVVASDPRQDLAILRMPAVAGIKPVTFAPADSVKRGHYAIALGNPYGLANEGKLAMSVGEVSATGRSLPSLSNKQGRLYNDLIQTTAEINPGNSGGPLFDCRGRVIGIITAVVLPQKNTSGIGFALPISQSIMARINALRAGQDINYGDLGLNAAQMSSRQRRSAGVPTETGVRVETVDAKGPCSSLREGDVLLTVDAASVDEIDDFTRLCAGLRAGVPARLTFIRAGKAFATTVTPRRRAAIVGATNGAAAPVSSLTQRFRWKGMTLGPIPENWDFEHGIRPEGGLMVLASDTTVKEALPAGTVVQSVGSCPIRTVADLQEALAKQTPDACGIRLWSATDIQEPKTLSTSGSSRDVAEDGR